MLINTVFLLLRDALPVFFLFSLLVALMPAKQQLQSNLMALLYGTFFSVLLQFNAATVIDRWQGSGLELALFTACTLSLLVFIIFLATNNQSRVFSHFVGVSLSMQWLISSTKMLTFYRAFWLDNHAATALILGTIIGLGLCTSLAIVLYFSLRALGRHTSSVTLLLLVIFFSGHFSKGISLLEQVGLINSEQLWSTQHWLPDDSEWVQILSALTGYEATPSYWQFFVFVGIALLLISLITYRHQRLAKTFTTTEVTP